MQAAYDAAQIRKRAKTIKVKRYVAKAARDSIPARRALGFPG
jgi:hypothetical protein